VVDFGSLFRGRASRAPADPPAGSTPDSAGAPPAGGASEATAADSLAAWFALGHDEEAVWSGLVPGPAVDDVASRLSSLPQQFLDERVSLRALAGDVLGGPRPAAVAELLARCAASPASRRGAAVALWLYASEDLVEPFDPMLDRAGVPRAIAALALRLAPTVDPAEWLVAAERREEAARAFLLWNGQLPAGEDVATARSLWDRHDSLRRNRALASALTDHQHRLEVLARLQTKRAAEASARYSHE
jgi:hypothetical protein